MSKLALLLGLCLALLRPGLADVVLRAGASGWQTGTARDCLVKLQAGLRGSDLRLALAPVATDLLQLKALHAGELQICLVRCAPLANYYRPWSLLELPYGFPEAEAARRWLDSLEGQRLKMPTEGQPWRTLACWSGGARWLASQAPVDDWSDLRGKTVRVAQSRFAWEALRFVGADPWAAPLEARSPGNYQVLEASRMDLEESGLLSGYSQLWDPGHGEQWWALLIDERAWSRLSAQHQQRLRAEVSLLESFWMQQVNSLSTRPLRVRLRVSSVQSQSRDRQRFAPLRKQLIRSLEGRWWERRL